MKIINIEEMETRGMRELSQREQLEGMMKRPIPRKRVGIIKLQAIREGKVLYGMRKFTKPAEAVEMVRPLVEYADREMMLVLTLDNVNTPIGVEIAAVGGVDYCYIDIKGLFKFAVLNNATSIVLFHNHPSGEVQESDADIRITRRIQQAAELLGIRLLDHIIVGDEGRFKSLRDEGIIAFTDMEDELNYSAERRMK